jgi:hypothetical protein
VEAYFFGNYTSRDTRAAGFYRPALDSRNIRSIYPNGYLPIEASNSIDQSLVAGLRGVTDGGWRWDLSANMAPTATASTSRTPQHQPGEPARRASTTASWRTCRP